MCVCVCVCVPAYACVGVCVWHVWSVYVCISGVKKLQNTKLSHKMYVAEIACSVIEKYKCHVVEEWTA